MVYSEIYIAHLDDDVEFRYHHLGLEEEDDVDLRVSFPFQQYKDALVNYQQIGKGTLTNGESTLEMGQGRLGIDLYVHDASKDNESSRLFETRLSLAELVALLKNKMKLTLSL
jgi:hypothetical protein